MQAESAARAPGVRTGDDAGWTDLVTHLAAQYGGRAGLFAHDFETQTSHCLSYSCGWPVEFLDAFRRNAAGNSWLVFLWKYEVGFFIDGGEINPIDRMVSVEAMTQFYQEFLVAQDLLRGMGAVLWKDRHPAPRWALSISILRSERAGFYSAQEKDDFRVWIPALVSHVAKHPWVRALRQA